MGRRVKDGHLVSNSIFSIMYVALFLESSNHSDESFMLYSGREWRPVRKRRRPKMQWDGSSPEKLLLLWVHLFVLLTRQSFADNPSQITPSDFKSTMEDYNAGMPQDPRKHGIPGCVSLFSLYAKEYSNYVIYIFEAFDVGTTADSVIMILPSSCKQPRRPSLAHHEAVALLRVCKSWR